MALDLSNIKKIQTASGVTIKKIQRKSDGAVLWSAGAVVTYVVDTASTYSEEVYSGESCLSPKTFTPTKSGYTFVGWREDKTASSSVLTSKIVDGNPVTLYAVFTQNITVTYYDTSTTAKTAQSPRYYNNGNTTSASFTLKQATSSGWTTRGWSTTNAGNASIVYADGATFTRDSDITLYGSYQKTLTVTYYDGDITAKTTTGTMYWAIAGNVYPKFTLTQTSKSGWSARGWSTGTAGNSGITYNNATQFAISDNITLYGMYQQTITVTYYNNSTSASSTTGTRYYNSGKNVYTNPSFTLAQASKSSWSPRGWSTSNAGNASVTYANNTAFTRESNVTLYGMYSTTITLSYNGNGSTSGSTSAQTGTAYWSPAGTIGATFSLASNGFARTDYTFNGWNLGAVGASVTLTSNTTAYAQWQANPFYWIKEFAVQSGYPSSFANYSVSPDPSDNGGCQLDNKLPLFCIGSTNEETGFDFSGSTVAVNTRGHKYIEIVMGPYMVDGTDAEAGYLTSFKVGGVECRSKVTENAVITVDISKLSTVSLYLNMNCWAWGNYMYMYFKSIRFYS